MKQYIFLPALLCVWSHLFGQIDIQGRVVSQSTGEPLSLVNIVVEQTSQRGAVSDLSGDFVLTDLNATDSLRFSSLGYQEKVIGVADLIAFSDIRVELIRKPETLPEFTVTDDRNRAMPIIRKARENRKLNNPNALEGYTCSIYNKVVIDPVITDLLKKDSIETSLDKTLKGGHLMLFESMSQMKYKHPGKREEIVKATKVSGISEPEFAALVSDFQPFGFYEDRISVLENEYLNPLAAEARGKYEFELTETLFDKGDSVFVISFYPRHNYASDLFEGVIYINSNRYAIQQIKARIPDGALVKAEIIQAYDWIDSSFWFPSSMQFEIQMPKYPSDQVGLQLQGKSWVSDISQQKSQDITIGYESKWLEPLAKSRDSSYWKTNRPVALQRRDSITYNVIDSVGKELNFNLINRVASSLVDYQVPVGFLDIELDRIVLVNRFEKARFGVGLNTNDKLLSWLELGGYAGFGLDDSQWKYGGKLNVKISRRLETQFNFTYDNTLNEVGGQAFIELIPRVYKPRDLIASRMDYHEEYRAEFETYTIRYLKSKLYVNQITKTPAYEYDFRLETDPQVASYRFNQIGLSLRYAYGEQIINHGGNHVHKKGKFPVLYLNYTRGLKNSLGDYAYNQVDIKLESSFYLWKLNRTDFALNSGWVDRDIPYAMLYTGMGSYDSRLPLYMKGYFQTMRPYEFLSDAFVSTNVSQVLAQWNPRVSWSRPEISAVQNVCWGTLANPNFQQKVSFQTLEHGYFESGISLKDVLRVNYLNIGYLGLGASVFTRYGAYSFPVWYDNLAYRIQLTFSTK